MGPVAQRRLVARFPNVASRAFWSAFDFILPPNCVSCRTTGDVFCGDCRSIVKIIQPPICTQCGFPTQAACPACHDNGVEGLQALRAATLYTGTIRKTIHSLKYRRNRALVNKLGEIMAAAWPQEFPADAILVPVPLAPKRARARGFNQAEVLARYVGREVGLPVRSRALRRIRETPPQVGMNAAERQQNMKAAFRARARAIKGRPVILIDDVSTTGSTLTACAETLRKAGASSVWGMTLARAGAHIHDA